MNIQDRRRNFLILAIQLFTWPNPRIVASLASVFILVNLLAGLIGLNMIGTFQIYYTLIFKVIIAVVLGGSLGSYLSNKRFNLKLMGFPTEMLVLYVGLRLVLSHGFDIYINFFDFTVTNSPSGISDSSILITFQIA